MESLNLIKPELLTLTSEQMTALMPYFWMMAGACLAIIGSVLQSMQPKWVVFVLSIASAFLAMVSTWNTLGHPPILLFNGMMVVDSYTRFGNLLFIASGVLTSLGAFRYLDREKIHLPEFHILVLFAVMGMMLMISSLDLIVLFIAFEIMSLCVYLLVGFRRSDRKGNEASVKYFILGGAASAVMLYGAALLYGATGSLNLSEILQYAVVGNDLSIIFVMGAWLMVVGFLFKVATVPFHMWMPDVYEGAPTPVTGFMTTGLKAAAFATFIRVILSLGYGRGMIESLQAQMHDLIWVIAVVTMLLGNIIALTQKNLKRMLAYSSIAHTGYLMVGLAAGGMGAPDYSSVLVYLVSYAIMNMGAFLTLTLMSGPNDEGLMLNDLSGMSQRRPWISFAMAVFVFSLAGVPPTAGFIGKYLLFYQAVQSGETLLVVIAVLCSAISVYYYLRVLVYMYMKDPQEAVGDQRVSLWSKVAIAFMVVLTLEIGLIPSGWIEAAKAAISHL
ncbi:MAG: NADH-quinone oxidoreductase subunit N [Bdellovibrionaceae bacterium]|nr:NADH-quinone oxidoreductase subunit N [Pseudobdellovibrionaceae bacterium]|tara:strand:+ start:4874 stop:6376 length:1503 start_codon:yes stop_codon:yes gene_type:complete